MPHRSIRFLDVIAAILTAAILVLAFLPHPQGSPVRPYFYAAIPPWMAVVSLRGWFAAHRRSGEFER